MINKTYVKKWIKMLSGKSILHVEQGVGKLYSADCVEGYYNDLTNKVLLDKEHLDSTEVFMHPTSDLSMHYFSIAIFQYGLGAYDLYLKYGDKVYYDKFSSHLQWAIENQLENGAWDTFSMEFPEAPYSAMAQGEGISLLARGYVTAVDEAGKRIISEKMKRAVDFMLKDVSDGGTALRKDGKIFLLEYTGKPMVLNGAIFAVFGLIDYIKVTGDEAVKDELSVILKTIAEYLPEFDNGYWSMYDLGGHIASPFYHDLHIAQLHVLADLTKKEIFGEYEMKFIKYKSSFFKRTRAFMKKAMQKIKEK